MHTFKPLTALLLVGLLSTSAVASEAHVCRSASVSQSSQGAELSDKTRFSCSSDVSGTIPSLSQAGWKITQVLEQADTAALASLKPGQIPQNPDELNKTYWILVIQK